jgi:hypothetical protein
VRPYQGYQIPIRLAFFTALRTALGRVTTRFPNSPSILAEDANLPEMQFDEQGRAVPHHTITQYFCDHFLSWLECASRAAGKPVASHKLGGILELILHSTNMRLICFEADTVRFSGCDHYPVHAVLVWQHRRPESNLLWIPDRSVSQHTFDAAICRTSGLPSTSG